jgi:hypothetical protein
MRFKIAAPRPNCSLFAAAPFFLRSGADWSDYVAVEIGPASKAGSRLSIYGMFAPARREKAHDRKNHAFVARWLYHTWKYFLMKDARSRSTVFTNATASVIGPRFSTSV